MELDQVRKGATTGVRDRVDGKHLVDPQIPRRRPGKGIEAGRRGCHDLVAAGFSEQVILARGHPALDVIAQFRRHPVAEMVVDESMEGRVGIAARVGVEDSPEELADRGLVFREKDRVAGIFIVPDQRENRIKDAAGLGDLEQVVLGRVRRVVTQTQHRVQVVRDQLHPAMNPVRHPGGGVVLVLAVPEARLAVVEQRHHRHPARHLIEIHHRRKRPDVIAGKRLVVPGSGGDIARVRAAEIRRGGGLPEVRESDHVRPVVAPALVALDPAGIDPVRSRGGGVVAGPTGLVLVLPVDLHVRHRRPMVVDVIAVHRLHPNPKAVVRILPGTAGDALDAIAADFHRRGIAARQARRLAQPHADELQPREFRVQAEFRNAVPAVVGGHRDLQRLVDEFPRAAAADPHAGAVADRRVRALAGDKGRVELAIRPLDPADVRGRSILGFELLVLVVFRGGEDQAVGRRGGALDLVVHLIGAVRGLAFRGRRRPAAGERAVAGADVEFHDRPVGHGTQRRGEAAVALMAHRQLLEGARRRGGRIPPMQGRPQRGRRILVQQLAGNRDHVAAPRDRG